MTTAPVPHPRPHVVVAGAGFGGLAAVRRLAKVPVDVTLIDRDNYHGFWPLLYQVATAGLGPDDIARPVRAVLSDQSNATFRMGTVTGVDLEGRTVHLDPGQGRPPVNISYDYLIIATGSTDNFFGIPGVAEHTFSMKTLPESVRLRNHVLTTFERADEDPSLVGSGALTTVLIGGGATGVELAGALSELVGNNLAVDFPHLQMSEARVILVEMADTLLGSFSKGSRKEAERTLRAKGVELRLNTKVAEVGPGKVTLEDGEVIEAGTIVWTAGVRASDVANDISGEKGRGGAIKVQPDLTVAGHPEVFAIGDIAAAGGKTGHIRRNKPKKKAEPLPGVAQVAIQGGKHAGSTIARRLAGKSSKPFRYHDHGAMATIGRRAAVAEIPGGLRFGGTLGWLSWLIIHLFFLIGFRNRLVVIANWSWNYLTWDRANRVILSDGDFDTQVGHIGKRIT